MKITGLSIDGFGLFNGTNVKDLSPRLSIFLGDNEAGKSTALAFIHTVLFGYPDGRSSEKSYPALEGGEPGGRLFVETDATGAMTIERRDGARGGSVTVTLGTGETGDGRVLDQVLGGTNRKLYRNLYGFSLTELQTIDTLTNDDVRDVIYGASMGTGLRTLPEARKHLTGRMSELFKPGGKNPTINGLLRQLADVRSEVADARKNIDQFEELGTQMATLTSEIERLRGDLSVARTHHARVQALLRLWDDWVALQQTEAELDGLEVRVETFPEGGLTRLETLNTEIVEQRRELEAAREELAARHRKLDELQFDAPMLEQGAEIRSLAHGVEAHEEKARGLPAAEDRARSCDERVHTILSEIGAGWTEDRALALDRSTHTRQAIDDFKHRIETCDHRTAADDVELASADNHLREAESERADAETRLESVRYDPIEVDSSVLTQLRDDRTRFASIVRDLPLRTSERDELENQIAGSLREIDPDWTVDTLERFDSSMTAQQRVEEFEEHFKETAANVQSCTTALDGAKNQLAKIEASVAEKRKLLGTDNADDSGPDDPDVLRQRRARLRQLDRVARQKEALVSEIAQNERSLDLIESAVAAEGATGLDRALAWAAFVITVLGAAGAGVLFLRTQPTAGFLSLIASLSAAILLLWFRTLLPEAPEVLDTEPDADDLHDLITEQTRQLAELAPDVDRLVAELKLPTIPSTAKLEQAIDAVDEEIFSLGSNQHLRESLRELVVELAEANKAHAVASDRLAEVAENRDRSTAEWSAHAASLQLSSSTTPRTASLVFAKAETVRRELRQLNEISTRIDEMNSDRTVYLQAMATVPALAEVTGKDSDTIQASLTSFLRDVELNEERKASAENALSLLADATKRAESAQAKLEKASEKRHAASEQRDAVATEWVEWLRAHAMDDGWSPESALHATDRTIRLGELVAERDAARTETAQLRSELEDFRNRSAQVFALLDLTVPAHTDLPAEIRRLEQQRGEHDQRRNLHSELSAEMPNDEARCETRRKRIEEAEHQKAELIAEGQAASEVEFQERGQAHERQLALTAKIASLESSIGTVAGVSELGQLRPELAVETRDALTARDAELTEQISSNDAVLADKLKQSGACKKHQDTLYSDDRVARLRAEEESLRERIADAARDWARHAVADHLIDSAKERHERANQPKVIQAAGGYFETITGGRYTQVFAPHGEDAMEVIDSEGRRKNATDLSRGAAEQLYLAIRFGYIAAHGAGGEPLPVLMDDVLVNFDPTRQARAAAAILELSRTRQVLYFTCHPQVLEIFRGEDSSVGAYVISDGGIQETG